MFQTPTTMICFAMIYLWIQLWPWLSVITGDFNGIILSTNVVSSVLIAGISGHNCMQAAGPASTEIQDPTN